MGADAPINPIVLKIDGTDTWISDIRSTFEVDRYASISYENSKFNNVNYGNLKFGKNKIYQGSLEYRTITSTTTGINGTDPEYILPKSTPTMSFYPNNWSELLINYGGDSNKVFANDFTPTATTAKFGGYLMTGSGAPNGEGGWFILGGGLTQMSQSINNDPGFNGSSVTYKVPGLALINSQNTNVSMSNAVYFKQAPAPVAITLGVPGNSTIDPNNNSSYIRENFTASGADGFIESESSSSLPFIIKKNDEIVCTFNTNEGAFNYVTADWITKVYTVTAVTGSNFDGSYDSGYDDYLNYSASWCDGTQCFADIPLRSRKDKYWNVIKVYPDPSNDGIAHGQLNAFTIRRRNEAGDRVIIYQTPPSSQITSITGSGGGYLIPTDFSAQQKRNVQTLINQLKAKNALQQDSDQFRNV